MGAVDEEVVEEDKFSGFGAFATDLDEGAFLFELAGGRDEDLKGGEGREGREGRVEIRRRIF